MRFIGKRKDMVNRFWNVKIWVTITLCSSFVYSLYWLFEVFEKAYLDFPGLYFSNPITAIAQTLHVIGLFIAIILVYLVWGPQANLFSDVKGKIAIALFLESMSYVLLTPFILSTLIASTIPYAVEAAVYGLYALLVSPLLMILSVKVKLSQKGLINRSVLRWAGAASLGYIATVWATIEIFWLSVVLMLGIQYLMTGATYVVFLNSVVILSLSLIFALLGLIPVILRGKISESTKKWCGLSLTLLGIHFIIYLFYAAFTNNLGFALSIDIWIISFIGLGLSLLKTETQKR